MAQKQSEKKSTSGTAGTTRKTSRETNRGAKSSGTPAPAAPNRARTEMKKK